MQEENGITVFFESMINKNKLLKPKQKINISDLKKLDQHVMENFVDDEAQIRELEINKDIYWVEGYMCAVWSSPHFIRMDDWLPFVNGDCTFESEKHINEIMSLIFGLQADIVSRLNNNSYEPLYEKYNIKDEPKTDLVKKWSKGYMFGTILSHSELLKKKEILEMLTPIVMFADGSKKSPLGKRGFSVEEVIKTIPMVINELAKVFHKMRAANIQKMVSKEPIVVKDSKLGRNDSCSCGSGKKYKKCCYANSI